MKDYIDKLYKATGWFINGLSWYKKFHLLIEPPALIMYVLLIIVGLYTSGYRVSIYRESVQQKGQDNQAGISETITTAKNVQGYDFYLLTKTDKEFTISTTLRIVKEGKVVYETSDYKFFSIFGELADDKVFEKAQDFADYALRDIVGNSTPELVFASFSGGAHCCYTTYILELADPVATLWEFNTESNNVIMVDINNDGTLELRAWDPAFHYWKTSYATSPSPEVILSFDAKSNKYAVNSAMMRKPPPSRTELEAKAKIWSTRGWEGLGEDCTESPGGGFVCSVPWGYALDLLYSGNIQAAITYVNLAWRDSEQFASKSVFWCGLKLHLMGSGYFEELSSTLIDINKLPCMPLADYPNFNQAVTATGNEYMGAKVQWFGVVATDLSQPGSAKFRIADPNNGYALGGKDDWFWAYPPDGEVINGYPPNVIIERYTNLNSNQYDIERDLFEITGTLDQIDCTYYNDVNGNPLCHPNVTLESMTRIWPL